LFNKKYFFQLFKLMIQKDAPYVVGVPLTLAALLLAPCRGDPMQNLDAMQTLKEQLGFTFLGAGWWRRGGVWSQEAPPLPPPAAGAEPLGPARGGGEGAAAAGSLARLVPG
jgi:hypothetical protein